MNEGSRLALAAGSAVWLAVAAAPGAVFGQAYPSKPVRLVVTYPPGGGSDIIARALGQRLTEVIGQTVVIDNRAGANGNIGTEHVARSPADGYTLVLGNTGPLCISPALYSKIPYDSAKDFAPITLVASSPIILVVHPSMPVKTVKDLVALARSRPKQINFASSGNGATSHLAGELVKITTGVELVHVPYKGVAPAVTDLVAGQVQMQFVDGSVVLGHVKSGRLRAVAWAGAQRGPALPDLPTVAESGLAGFDVTGWYGILAPAGTPQPVIDRLHGALVTVVKSPQIKERFDSFGSIPLTSTPQEFAAYIRDELVKWAGVVKASGARID